MSMQAFSDHCPDCRPAVIDPATGRALPESDPIMQTVLMVWDRTTREERQAFHRVTCLNSRQRSDMRLMQGIIGRIKTAMAMMDAPPAGHG